jgi:hypothetical protein
MGKPERLYHASANRSIKKFIPKAEKVRDPLEGPRVFATHDKPLSTIFMAGEGDRTDDTWTIKGTFNDVPYMVISDRERFTKLDQGGAIYHLPGETFETDPNRGMGLWEWTSDVEVTPVKKEEHESALGVMIEHGVQVYFVDQEIFAAIVASSDHGLSILQSLESENQKRGINIKQLS